MSRGGCLVVNMITFNYNDPSSSHAEDYSYFNNKKMFEKR